MDFLNHPRKRKNQLRETSVQSRLQIFLPYFEIEPFRNFNKIPTSEEGFYEEASHIMKMS
jgi:hypothetical protein